MSGPRTSPCNWPLAYCNDTPAGSSAPDESAPNPLRTCSHLNSLDPAVAEMIESAATEYLWNWTGKQFGTCEVTLRPCRKACGDWWTTYRGFRWQGVQLPWFGGWGAGPVNPALIGGAWYNLPCGCEGECSCGPIYEIELPGPVASVVEVVLGGVALPSSAYRIDNFRRLVRLDGHDWPVCQDMDADPAVPGTNTFAVTYSIGREVPAGGQIAAGKLACEMAKAACGSSNCQLPQRLQTITRQGITTAFLDSFTEMYTEGTTGLWLVDSWVGSINGPSRRRGPGRVASPDVRPPRRTTG